MERIYFITYKEKRVLIQDASNMNGGSEFKKIIQQAKKTIKSEPLNSILALFDASNCSFSDETMTVMKDYVQGNTPYIKAVAVVGATGLLQMALSTLARSSGREFNSFKTREEALEFLTSYDE